jgi:UDP-N-acetylmuramoyl-L-alanine---L-glutamate ligase
MLTAELEDKRILIAGFGREGQDSLLFLRRAFPDKSIGIADKKEFGEFTPDAQKLLNKDRKIVLYLGSDYLKQINKHDVILKSPGIPLKAISPFLQKGQILTSQTNIFFDNCPGTIIGVTGTKGKSTTASLIYEVLRNGGIHAHLIGNIEEPVLRFLEKAKPQDVFVYELSSFQLETAHASPHIAVLLNLYPEHLDHHETFKKYAAAKANIAKFQFAEDYLIFNEQEENLKAIIAQSPAQKIAFKPRKTKNSSIIASEQPALIIAELFDIPKEKAQEAIKRFKPLPHRLEPVGTIKKITFVNDSLATIPEATIAALDTLGPKVRTLIAGGFDRGINFENLALRIAKSNIQTLILFPTTGEIIWRELEKTKREKLPRHFFVRDMEEAITLCYEHTPKGSICLLSPASSSFTLFRDYKHRGEEFKKFVISHGKKKNS